MASIALLSAAMPALLLADVPNTWRSEGWILTLIVMVWAGVRLSLIWVKGVPRLFDFFVWLFVYIFMGIAPTVQMRSGLTSTTTPGIDAGFDVPTAGVVVLGLVCYEAGRVAWIARERYRRRAGGDFIRRVDTRRTAVLLVVAVALSGYVLSRLGVTGALGSREAAGAAREAAWPDPAVRALIYASGVYPLLVAIGALAQIARAAVEPGRRRLAVVLAVGGAGVLLLIVNPVASARYTFGTVAFALAVYAGAVASRRAARITMAATIAGFLFVFPVADAFRRAEVRASRSGLFDEYLSNPDYDAFWQVSNALSYWIDGLVVFFRQFLGSALFWFPRSMWPDKPTDTGIVLAEYRGYSFHNLSAPVWAEAIVNGGVVGVVVVFLALGALLRGLDTRIVPALRHGGVWGIVGAVLPVFMTILLRGSLLQATGALVVTIACIVVVRGPRERLSEDHETAAPGSLHGSLLQGAPDPGSPGSRSSVPAVVSAEPTAQERSR